MLLASSGPHHRQERGRPNGAGRSRRDCALPLSYGPLGRGGWGHAPVPRRAAAPNGPAPIPLRAATLSRATSQRRPCPLLRPPKWASRQGWQGRSGPLTSAPRPAPPGEISSPRAARPDAGSLPHVAPCRAFSRPGRAGWALQGPLPRADRLRRQASAHGRDKRYCAREGSERL